MAPSTRKAIIDVGTNSVKLLVAEVAGSQVLPIVETSRQTRLGRGFYEQHRLQREAIVQTAQAVAEFGETARQAKATVLRVVATSAARDADNRHELTDAIAKASGLAVEIISGEQEAEWVFRGVTTDPKLAGERLLILDVGGGSTEFILGEGGHHSVRQSFPLGAVRLFEKLRPGEPPSLADLAKCRGWLTEFFGERIVPTLASALHDPARPAVKLVGTGGTTTILARMTHQMTDFDRTRLDGTHLSKPQILEYMVHLWSLPLADRKMIVGLPPNRADIILTGLAIYEAVMEHFHFGALLVSTRGLRFGALLDGA